MVWTRDYQAVVWFGRECSAYGRGAFDNLNGNNQYECLYHCLDFAVKARASYLAAPVISSFKLYGPI